MTVADFIGNVAPFTYIRVVQDKDGTDVIIYDSKQEHDIAPDIMMHSVMYVGCTGGDTIVLFV